jgi:polar amino acid transport system substrate-binding protein
MIFCCSGVATAEDITLIFNAATNDPLSNEFGSGFADLVLHEALKKNGYQLKRVQLPAERALRDVNSGVLDGEILRISGLQKKYPQILQVPEPIVAIDFVAFSNIELDLSKGWDSLGPYQLAFLRGWKIIESHIPKNARFTKVNYPQQMFHMLSRDRTEVIIYERLEGLNIITNDPAYGKIKVRLPPLASRKMYCYLNQKHRQLVTALANTIREMKQDGRYEQFYQQTIFRHKR